MKDEQKKIIEAIIRTLNKISVNGKENMDMLLACILAMENLLKGEEENG